MTLFKSESVITKKCISQNSVEKLHSDFALYTTGLTFLESSSSSQEWTSASSLVRRAASAHAPKRTAVSGTWWRSRSSGRTPVAGCTGAAQRCASFEFSHQMFAHFKINMLSKRPNVIQALIFAFYKS